MISTYTKQRLSVIPQTELTALVGNTPLLPLRRIAGDLWPQVQIYAKAEWFNPSGSVKDRPALNIIRQAIARGELGNGRRLLDSTSGNMGIAYASLGVSLGIPVTLTIPSNASPERLGILRALGAELILTDPTEGTDGALVVAQEMAEADPEKYYYANQYDNPANWQAHYLTTGPEVWQQTGGEVTHFVAGLGTSGTITGTTRYLKEQNPDIQSIAVQPNAPFHGLEGLKYMPSSLQPGIYDPDVFDRLIEVPTERAYEMVRRLGREEGLFVGLSSGAAAMAASQVAREIESGVVVTVFPDAGYKYLSTNIWEEPK
jgi:cysteine synthase B